MSPSIIDRDMEEANGAAGENGPNPGEPPRFLSRRRWSQSTGRKSGSKIDLRKEQARKQEANDNGLMRGGLGGSDRGNGWGREGDSSRYLRVFFLGSFSHTSCNKTVRRRVAANADQRGVWDCASSIGGGMVSVGFSRSRLQGCCSDQ
ncbi:unnamed protein product [Lactuca virosa]|uniref:Uncharacterized protein n=1 Tax=Lactuca virosa TaxID=75947 RepID=A0AAU9LTT9_9ASTR|nr:unnamed protein product [Lactuca virosa]